MSLELSPVAIVEILGIGQCLFFGICVLGTKGRNAANIYLAAFMFASAVYLLDAFFTSTSFWPAMEDLLWPADFLLPPLLYLYVRALTAPTPSIVTMRDLRHLAFFVVALMLALPYLTLPWPVRLEVAELGENLGILIQSFDLAEQSSRLFIAAIGMEIFINLHFLQVSFYLVLTYLTFRRHSDNLRSVHSNIEKLDLFWLRCLIVFLFALWLFFVPWEFIDRYVVELGKEIELATGIAQLLALYMLGIVGLRQPALYDLANARILAGLSVDSQDTPCDGLTEGGGPKYARTAFDESDLERILAKIDDRMVSEKLFLNSSLTLSDLAQRSGVTANAISQALNQRRGRNFFDYVNGYRIGMAKERLLSSDERILDIALDVGFNAKSTFNAAFKKACGQTPLQFRGRRAPAPTSHHQEA